MNNIIILTHAEVASSKFTPFARRQLFDEGRPLREVVINLVVLGSSEVYAKSLVVAVMASSYLG